jgi:hypothetical protein
LASGAKNDSGTFSTSSLMKDSPTENTSPDHPSPDQQIQKLTHLDEQRRRRNEFMRQISNPRPATNGLNWLEDLLIDFTQWDECQVLTLPAHQRGSLDEWKHERRWWAALFNAAQEDSGHFRLDQTVENLWLRKRRVWLDAHPDRDPSRKIVDVVYAWMPRRGRSASLLMARKFTPATIDEREEITTDLRLAALVIAGARTTPESLTFIGNYFREREDIYRRYKTQLEDRRQALLADPESKILLELLDSLPRVLPGAADAEAFKELVADVFDEIFSPDLVRLRTEVELHGGRKRIDIVYCNRSGQHGLFHDLPARYMVPCPYVIVECKNYHDDPNNPEIDQLLGRFGGGRGNFGFLVCNEIKDRIEVLMRCREATRDHRGWVIALDLDDLAALLCAKLLAKPLGQASLMWDLLDDHFRTLTF